MKEARAVDDNVNSIEREDSEIVLTCQEAMKTADEGSCLSDSRSQVDGGELCRTSPKTGRKRELAERNKPFLDVMWQCKFSDDDGGIRSEP
ncbi:UNVERIFIED_CONTAM: hypothetical protein FKN15_001474 [Acipenser sinensis]